MKLTAKVKLLCSDEQHRALLQTLERTNEACNYVSEIAWRERTFRQFALHKLVYYDTKERFSLTAQMVVRVEGKVADAYKQDCKVKRTFRSHGAIAYDARILKWKLSESRVSIWTLAGRQTIPFATGERQRAWLEFQKGESDLVLSNGAFYLLATCDVPEPSPEEVEGYLGVDMGVVELATDSKGTSYSGVKVKEVRRKRRKHRKSLQKRGTKSAKRRLKKLAGKESRFARDTNHCVAKAIVTTAEHNRLGIAVETLTGIRGRARVRRAARDDLHSWAFHQLGEFLRYKARLKGVSVVEVSAKNTSRICAKCGHCEKANRKSQAEFTCQSCGHRDNADLNAAKNIAARAHTKAPIVSSGGLMSDHVSSQGQAF